MTCSWCWEWDLLPFRHNSINQVQHWSAVCVPVHHKGFRWGAGQAISHSKLGKLDFLALYTRALPCWNRTQSNATWLEAPLNHIDLVLWVPLFGTKGSRTTQEQKPHTKAICSLWLLSFLLTWRWSINIERLSQQGRCRKWRKWGCNGCEEEKSEN